MFSTEISKLNRIFSYIIANESGNLDITFSEMKEYYNTLDDAIDDSIGDNCNKRVDFEFEGVNYLLIHEDDILAVAKEYIESDLYVLGGYYSDFLAKVTNFSKALIDACQEAEAFEALGQAIVDTCNMWEFAEAAIDADGGYGELFNYEDGSETLLGDINYYIFKLGC